MWQTQFSYYWCQLILLTIIITQLRSINQQTQLMISLQSNHHQIFQLKMPSSPNKSNKQTILFMRIILQQIYQVSIQLLFLVLFFPSSARMSIFIFPMSMFSFFFSSTGARLFLLCPKDYFKIIEFRMGLGSAILAKLLFLFLPVLSLKAKLSLVFRSVRFRGRESVLCLWFKYSFLESSLTNILTFSFSFLRRSPRDLAVVSGKISMFYLNKKGVIVQVISSSSNLDLAVICPTCFSVITIYTIPRYLLRSDSWVLIVCSIYYFSASYSCLKSLIYYWLCIYFVFSYWNRCLSKSTSQLRDLQLVSKLISSSSLFFLSSIYCCYFHCCSFNFSFNLFIFYSSVASSSTSSFCNNFYRASNFFLNSSFSSWSKFLIFQLFYDFSGIFPLTSKLGSIPSNIFFNLFISSAYCLNRVSLGSSFTIGLFLMNLVRLAYRSVLNVSSQESSEGDIVAIMTVCVLPPNESCKSLVNLESLQGICEDFPSTKADMTFPKALRDRFILVVYFKPTPAILSLLCLYDPARSTRLSLPDLQSSFPSRVSSADSIQMVNMQ